MKRIILILISLTIVSGIGYSQAPIKRKKKENTEQTQSTSSKPNQQSAQNNKRKKQSSIKVSEPDGYINGHGYVDLGLPSGMKWATCNVGASIPSDPGEYYAWGKTISHLYHTIDDSYFRKTADDLRALGIIDANGNLNNPHDVASRKWGSSWQIPTVENFQELCSMCTLEVIKVEGKNIFKITGPNGKSILFPASGRRWVSKIQYKGIHGNYWTAHVEDNELEYAKSLFIDGYDHKLYVRNSDKRHCGYSVRPVSE